MNAVAENEIAITRLYDATVAQVWSAWTDPEQLAQWWGPRGFRITTHSKDTRSGGSWDYAMHGPDGTDYPNITQYLEVVTGVRMVYDHGGSADRPPVFRVHVEFAAVGTKTEMAMRMVLPTAAAAAETRKFVRQANGNTTWDRLAEYLDKTLRSRERFVIARSFECSVEKLFSMWSDPKLFAEWLAPTGFTMTYLREELRAGGRCHSRMQNAEGMLMYSTCQYSEIEAPARIVYTQQFSDEHEGRTRHPMAPNWPESMRTTIDFFAEGPGHARMALSWEPEGDVPAADLAVFVAARANMTQGWTSSLDQLEAYLAKPRAEK